jgi:Tfp pilus assembly protein PilO
MSTVRLRTELWLAQVGPWRLLLAWGSVAAIVMWTLLLGAQERQLVQGREFAVAASAQVSSARPAPLADPADTDSLQAFERGLASDADARRLMQRIWSDAARTGVRLSKVDYRTEVDLAGGFSRLQISMPLGGTYPAMKKFVFGLMAMSPMLSLDKLDIKRESASQPDIEATLHMTLLVRS